MDQTKDDSGDMQRHSKGNRTPYGREKHNSGNARDQPGGRRDRDQGNDDRHNRSNRSRPRKSKWEDNTDQQGMMAGNMNQIQMGNAAQWGGPAMGNNYPQNMMPQQSMDGDFQQNAMMQPLPDGSFPSNQMMQGNYPLMMNQQQQPMDKNYPNAIMPNQGMPGMQAQGMPGIQGQGMPGMQGQGMPGMQGQGMQGMQGQGMPGMSQGMGGMQPNMMGMSNMMAGGMMDPMYQQQMSMMMMQMQPIYLSCGVLQPPVPGSNPPPRKQCPLGCRTLFIGGLPKNITEEVISEIFQRFGTIANINLSRKGFAHLRFEREESIEPAFSLAGYRFQSSNGDESEVTTLLIDYAANRDDRDEFEKKSRRREKTPPRVEPCTAAALAAVADKIKSEGHFSEAAPTLAYWLERGECNKKNVNTFYSLIQSSNNQISRILNEKMQLDEEFQNLKSTMGIKFQNIITQFEQVVKILTAAKHQRVWDQLSKQQRRNIEMWQHITEELENIKEEYSMFLDEDDDRPQSGKTVPEEKYEELKRENESLVYELEGYRNDAHLAKDEAERKFEKFKAHFIAQQALNQGQGYSPMLPPPMPSFEETKNLFPPLPPDDKKVHLSGAGVPPTAAKLISMVTALLLVHPKGASIDYILSYLRAMIPEVNQVTLHKVLKEYKDVFAYKKTAVGGNIEYRWFFASFNHYNC